MLIVVARYVVSQGHVDQVAPLLRANAEASRREPGCLEFSVFQDADDPPRILLYEQYTDEAGLQAHAASDHFQRLAANYAIPELLESREREFFETFYDDRGGLGG